MLGGSAAADDTVICIACGESLPRSAAREYDKTGDRWERHDKEFEHFCKDCFRELCHQPRTGLESTVETIEAEGLSAGEFAERFLSAVADEESDSTAEPETFEESDSNDT